MNPRFYQWYKGKVFTSNVDGRTKTGKLTVDTGYDQPNHRYGRYSHSKGWEHIPFSQFPTEFKAHLLLLGIQ